MNFMPEKVPRYNLGSVWPAAPIESVPPLASLPAPVSTALLQDTRNFAEVVSAAAGNPKVVENIMMLIDEAPKFPVDGDGEFANSVYAPDGPHGTSSAAAGILNMALTKEPELFSPSKDSAQFIPVAMPSPRKKKTSMKPRARKSSQLSAKAASTEQSGDGTSSAVADTADTADPERIMSPEDVQSLQPGFRFWLKWDDPENLPLHDKWFLASISAQQPFTEPAQADKWTGHYLLEFVEDDFVVQSAFDLGQYASFQRLKRLDSSHLAQGSGTITSGAPAKKRRQSKTKAKPQEQDNTPARQRRLVGFVQDLVERVGSEELSTANENALSPKDVRNLLSDVNLAKDACPSPVSVLADSSEGAEIWGVGVDEWHTVILVLDRYIQRGVEHLEQKESVVDLASCLDAALVTLTLATIPDRPKKLLIAETIDNILGFVRCTLTQVVFPKVDLLAAPGDEKAPKGVAPKKLSAKSEKMIMQLVSCTCGVLEQLVALCHAETLEDGMVCALSSLASSLFFAEGASFVQLQLSGIELLCTISVRLPQHRAMIVDDVFSSFAKLNTGSKKNIRLYAVSPDRSVQMVCALVLRLLQSYTPSPPALMPGQTPDDQTAFETSWDESTTGYKEGLDAAKFFCSNFIKKCQTKKEEGDHRVLLDRFIDDLTYMLAMPAWPMAEVVLRLLTFMMIGEVRESNAALKDKRVEAGYRGFLVEMLGLIACKVHQEALSCQSESDFVAGLTKQMLSDGAADDGSGDSDELQEKAVRSCMLRNAQTTPCSTACSTVAVHLNLWIDSEDTSVTKESLSGLLGKLSERTTSDLEPESPFSADEAAACWRFFAQDRHLLRRRPLLLETMLFVFNDTNISLRTKAVKVMTSLMQIDISIFGDEKVKHAIQVSILDAAASVRESMVDLLGKVMDMSEEYTNDYLPLVLERTMDTGKSVRKKCVQILYRVLAANPLHARAPDVLLRLAGRCDDEDSIRELIIGTFRDLWFNPDLQPRLGTYLQNSQQGQQPAITTGGSGLGDGKSIVLTLAQRVNQILDLIRVSNGTSQTKIVSLLNAILGKSPRESEKKPQGFVANSTTSTAEDKAEMCAKMCDQIVETLLRLDECGEDEMQDDAGSAHSLSPRTCCIIALNVFCKTSSTFLCPHVTTIEPYLKEDVPAPGAAAKSKQEAIVLQYSADIIRECLPELSNPDLQFQTSLQEDLLSLINRAQHFGILTSCIRCYCACFDWVFHEDKKIRHVVTTMHSVLKNAVGKYTDPRHKAAPNSALLMKALFGVGLFSRYYDFDKKPSGGGDSNAAGPSLEKMKSVCLQYAGVTCQNALLQAKAMEALGNIFCRSPRLLLDDEVQAVLEAGMTSSNVENKKQVLRALSEVLVEDERKNRAKDAGSGNIAASVESAEMQAFCDTADDSKGREKDTGLSGGLMQRYLQRLKTLLHDGDQFVRKDAVGIVAIILRQGLVHPMECVPHIVALETDRHPLVRQGVARVLKHLDDKHHDLIKTRIVDGIEMSYDFQRNTFGDVSATCGSQSESSFARVYTYIRPKKKDRDQLLKALLNKFAIGPKSDVNLPLLRYLALVLTSLPLNFRDEVVYMLSHITRLLSLHATPLTDTLKSVFADLEGGKANKDACHLLRPLQEECRAGTAMCLLAKMKAYLKTVYNVAESQIAEYSSVDDKHSKMPIKRKHEGKPLYLKDLKIDEGGGVEADELLWKRFMQLRDLVRKADVDPKGVAKTTSAAKREDEDDDYQAPTAAAGGAVSHGLQLQSRQIIPIAAAG